ncbi:MAG: ChrR family anti-sigma-E factor [Geminicoccaceae bacterium]
MNSTISAPEELLLDHAAGTAGPALDLLISTHLSMSKGSRDLCEMLEAVAGTFLETMDGEPMALVTAKSVLEAADRDDAGDGDFRQAGHTLSAGAAGMLGATPVRYGGCDLPLPLRGLSRNFSDDRQWRRLGAGVAAATLSVPSDQERVHLLWAKPGCAIATHRHIGREVVLVLKGAFWDEGVRFGPGDIAVGDDGTIHTPRIDDQEDCICLAVTEAPVEFVGPFGWLLNRFCRF